jgi:hypothetical protein
MHYSSLQHELGRNIHDLLNLQYIECVRHFECLQFATLQDD